MLRWNSVQSSQCPHVSIVSIYHYLNQVSPYSYTKQTREQRSLTKFFILLKTDLNQLLLTTFLCFLIYPRGSSLENRISYAVVPTSKCSRITKPYKESLPLDWQSWSQLSSLLKEDLSWTFHFLNPWVLLLI